MGKGTVMGEQNPTGTAWVAFVPYSLMLCIS